MCGCQNKSPQQMQQQAKANAALIEEYRKKNTGISDNPMATKVADTVIQSFKKYNCSTYLDCPPGMICAGSRCVKKTMTTNVRSLR